MSMIEIVCPHCRETLEAEISLLGTNVTCPGCKRNFNVPKFAAIGKTKTPKQTLRMSATMVLCIVLAMVFLGGIICVLAIRHADKMEKRRQADEMIRKSRETYEEIMRIYDLSPYK